MVIVGAKCLTEGSGEIHGDEREHKMKEVIKDPAIQSGI